jgi:DNA polymerase-3 subunit gamma/tau
MAYQVLARKWRPQDFSSVVGQEPIVTALQNALSEGRIAQAYLFSGIRGVGKTSVARILAKALNCEKGPAANPCNECTSCTEITASTGSNLDVHEIDAATHSKVEQVRDLTEGLKYGPARDRYKVVIIDEIHRLSRQAFDALLKIVEEPPPHLVFIFATTESEAVPVTILSRCQEFRFRRVPSLALAEHLRELSTAEEIEISDKALRLIARAGDGSVRDAVALLDQLATFGSGKITDEEAARILGGVDHALFLRLLSAIVGGDSREVSAVVRDVEGQGWDPRHVYGEFLNYGRDALHLALGGAAADVDLPEEEAKSLGKVAKKAGYENLLRLVHQMLASENTVRRSETGSLALEICWLRAAELPKLIRVEQILGGKVPEGSSSAPAGSDSEGEEEPPASGRLFTPADKGTDASPLGRETAPVPETKPSTASGAPPRETAAASAEPETPSVASHPEPGPEAEPAPLPEPPAASAGPETASAAPQAEPDPQLESAPIPTPAAETADAPASRPTTPAGSEPAATPPEASSAPESQAATATSGDVGTSAHFTPAAPTPEPLPETDSIPLPEPDFAPPVDPTPAPKTQVVNGEIQSFLDEVSRRKQPLAAHLREAHHIVFEDNAVRIFALPNDAWLNLASLTRQSNKQALEGAIAATFGEEASWKLVECEAEEAPRPPEPEPEVDAATQDPRVQKVLDIFGGHVEALDDS